MDVSLSKDERDLRNTYSAAVKDLAHLHIDDLMEDWDGPDLDRTVSKYGYPVLKYDNPDTGVEIHMAYSRSDETNRLGFMRPGWRMNDGDIGIRYAIDHYTGTPWPERKANLIRAMAKGIEFVNLTKNTDVAIHCIGYLMGRFGDSYRDNEDRLNYKIDPPSLMLGQRVRFKPFIDQVDSPIKRYVELEVPLDVMPNDLMDRIQSDRSDEPSYIIGEKYTEGRIDEITKFLKLVDLPGIAPRNAPVQVVTEDA